MVKHDDAIYEITKIDEKAFTEIPVERITLPKTIKTLGKKSFSNRRIIEVNMSLTKITIIPEECFANTTFLTKITLPNTLKSIKEKAFIKSSINRIIIPDSLEEIGRKAFSKSQIRKLRLEKTRIKALKKESLSYCSFLKYIHLPEKLSLIEADVFIGSQINKIILPETIKELTDGAFEDLSFLTTADLSKLKITEVPRNCFKKCISLINLTLPETIEAIQSWSFYKTAIKSIEIPKHVTIINESAFECCNSLTTVLFNTDLETIEKSAFIHCPSLVNIKINNNCKSLHKEAFADTGLEKIVLPKSIKYAENALFRDCTQLKAADLSNAQIYSLNSHMFCNCYQLSFIRFPTAMVEIEAFALAGTSLKTFQGKGTLTSLGKMCFANSDLLEIVDLTYSEVTKIPYGMFVNCSSLREVLLNSRIKSFSSFIITNTGITHISIPYSLIVISNHTFYKSSIESINMSHCIIYTLPFGIFAECKKLEEVYLPKCLECIKEKAFFRCESLMSITFPSSIRDIEKKAFQECQSLVELNMSFMRLKTLNDKLFFNCKGLEYIELPNCLQSIGSDVFYQTGITGLIIPPSTATITTKSFIGMSELIKITLADTQITRIYSTTFSKCFNLYEVQLPTCLEYLEENAFIDCTLLYNLIYCGTSKFSYLKLFSSHPYVTVTIDYPSRTFAGIKVRRSNKCYYMEVFQTIKEDSNKNKKEWSNVLSGYRKRDGIEETDENKKEEQEEEFFYDPEPTKEHHEKKKETRKNEDEDEKGENYIYVIAIIFISFSVLLGIVSLFNQECFYRPIVMRVKEATSSQSGSHRSADGEIRKRGKSAITNDFMH